MSQPSALIIDDDAKNVAVLAGLLSQQDVDAIKVLHPLQLDSVLQDVDSVDVVFLDLEMPGMNGYEVLQVLKSDARFQRVPIVAYTVHVSEINTAYEQGFHSFLGKPLDPDRFADQLTRIFNNEPVWDKG
jgi:CheY-like chemotaxis protein